MRLGQQIASLIYPLDTFSMYARMPVEDRSLLLVRDQQGTVHHVTAFRTFDCLEEIARGASECRERFGIQYFYEDLLRYIESHRGAGDLEVELITRTWELRAGAAPEQTEDCIITRCKVSR